MAGWQEAGCRQWAVDVASKAPSPEHDFSSWYR